MLINRFYVYMIVPVIFWFLVHLKLLFIIYIGQVLFVIQDDIICSQIKCPFYLLLVGSGCFFPFNLSFLTGHLFDCFLNQSHIIGGFKRAVQPSCFEVLIILPLPPSTAAITS